MSGAEVGEIELNDGVFGDEPHISAMHAVVRAYLNAQRQGTQAASTRTEARRRPQDLSSEVGTGNAHIMAAGLP